MMYEMDVRIFGHVQKNVKLCFVQGATGMSASGRFRSGDGR
jgi:hypothetical protein